MRHFWVFESLLELRDYALANGMPRLAASVQVAIRAAYDEIDPLDPRNAGPATPPKR
jgi:hypothetical protein